jgi:hypothetical protein
MDAGDIIADVRSLLTGEPVFMAGSLVAEEAYGKSSAHHDVDLFCPTSQVLIAVVQRLLEHGYKLDDRFERVWHRWLRYGFKTWHTNSIRLHSPSGVETNLVYKLTDGHPTTSLAQVLESFDFGLLGMGYDLESGTYRDLRPYLFPQFYSTSDAAVFKSYHGPLPMMPNKRDNWRNGFISQYNGLREFGRYAKYHEYGYDMSLVKDDLATGYWSAAAYLTNSFDQDKQQLGHIYEAIAQHIELDNIVELQEATAKIDYKDSLDVIMEALE